MSGDRTKKENGEDPQVEPAAERELRLRKEARKVVTVEECGKIIGKIIFPVDGDVFGPWRGAVYLSRD